MLIIYSTLLIAGLHLSSIKAPFILSSNMGRSRPILQAYPGKAGRFVSLVNCYAALVLADNATFLLAVNRAVAFRKIVANQPH